MMFLWSTPGASRIHDLLRNAINAAITSHTCMLSLRDEASTGHVHEPCGGRQRKPRGRTEEALCHLVYTSTEGSPTILRPSGEVSALPSVEVSTPLCPLSARVLRCLSSSLHRPSFLLILLFRFSGELPAGFPCMLSALSAPPLRCKV